MKKRATKLIKTILWVAVWSAVFLAVYAALSWVMRDMYAQKFGAVESREVVTESALSAAVGETEEVRADGLTIYAEGDGPAPEWYDPSEPMAAEWTAAKVGRRDIGCSDFEYTAPDYLLDVPLDCGLQEYIFGLCEESGLPYTLVVAVIEAESSYVPWCVSASGDYGLMQISSVCHGWLADALGIADFLDPRQNVRAGVYILAGYYQLYGYESGALMAYNLGQSAAEELFARGIYETDYSERVMAIRERLEEDNG